MSFFLGFLAGFITVPALALLFVLYIKSVGKYGPIQATAVVYEHQVGESKWEAHKHAYNAWAPQFIQRARFRRDEDRCVYAKLGKEPGRVWDDELRYIAQEELGFDLDLNIDRWTQAENVLMERYGLTRYDSDAPLPSGSARIDPMAREQFRRQLLAETAHS